MICKRCSKRVKDGEVQIKRGPLNDHLFHAACGQRMIKRLPPACEVFQVGPKIHLINEAGTVYTLPDDLARMSRGV